MSDALTVPTDARLEEIAVEIETIQGVALLKVGERLTEARDLFKYNRDEGGFAGWVESRVKVSRRTAYNLIDVFRSFGSDASESVQSLHKSVLYALAAPSTPEPVRVEAMRMAEAGESVDLDVVADLKRQLVDAKTSAKTARADHKNEQMFAKAAAEERDRFRYELDYAQSKIQQQADEIERLKQDGVIHSYPAAPAEVIQAVSRRPADGKPGSLIPAVAALIADGCRRDLDEIIGMLRVEGIYGLAQELQAVASAQSEAA